MIVFGKLGVRILFEQKVHAIPGFVYDQHFQVVAGLAFYRAPLHQVAVDVFNLTVMSTASGFENIA